MPPGMLQKTTALIFVFLRNFQAVSRKDLDLGDVWALKPLDQKAFLWQNLSATPSSTPHNPAPIPSGEAPEPGSPVSGTPTFDLKRFPIQAIRRPGADGQSAWCRHC